MAIKVKVERTKDGTYWGTTQNIPGVVSADGSSLEELKENLKEAVELYVDTAKEHDKEIYEKLSVGFEFEYQLEMHEIFETFDVLNKSAFARRAGINPTLMRQYSTKKNVYISEERAKQIQKELHNLGEELLAIKL